MRWLVGWRKIASMALNPRESCVSSCDVYFYRHGLSDKLICRDRRVENRDTELRARIMEFEKSSAEDTNLRARMIDLEESITYLCLYDVVSTITVSLYFFQIILHYYWILWDSKNRRNGDFFCNVTTSVVKLEWTELEWIGWLWTFSRMNWHPVWDISCLNSFYNICLDLVLITCGLDWLYWW